MSIIEETVVDFNTHPREFTINRAQSTWATLHLGSSFRTKMKVTFKPNNEMECYMMSNLGKPVPQWIAKVLWVNMTPLEGINWEEFVTEKLATGVYHGAIISAVGNSKKDCMTVLKSLGLNCVTTCTGLGIDGGVFVFVQGDGLTVLGPSDKKDPKVAKFVLWGHNF